MLGLLEEEIGLQVIQTPRPGHRQQCKDKTKPFGGGGGIIIWMIVLRHQIINMNEHACGWLLILVVARSGQKQTPPSLSQRERTRERERERTHLCLLLLLLVA